MGSSVDKGFEIRAAAFLTSRSSQAKRFFKQLCGAEESFTFAYTVFIVSYGETILKSPGIPNIMPPDPGPFGYSDFNSLSRIPASLSFFSNAAILAKALDAVPRAMMPKINPTTSIAPPSRLTLLWFYLYIAVAVLNCFEIRQTCVVGRDPAIPAA